MPGSDSLRGFTPFSRKMLDIRHGLAETTAFLCTPPPRLVPPRDVCCTSGGDTQLKDLSKIEIDSLSRTH